MKRVVTFFSVLALLLTTTCAAHAGWRDDFIVALKNGGALVVDDKGEVILQHRADEHFIPASTIKVATAAATIRVFGEGYRFTTDFFRDGATLYMKGYGDPFLVSEEFPRIVKGLKADGFSGAERVVVDHSYFDRHVEVDGAGNSLNPYDALNGALIANFNTVNVHKSKGVVVSAETQTPLTPLAREAARRASGRINLGKDPDIGARYAGELLIAFLEKEGVASPRSVAVGAVPAGLKPFYRHRSSKTLDDNLKGLLEFSTNFISNQLFLCMGAQQYGAPATVEKGLKALKGFLRDEAGWDNFELAEGAGLSRQNRVTPIQMVGLLNVFAPHRNLLPVKEGVLRAKTGTLTGVNTLVGYFPGKNGALVRFAILVNSPVPYDYKFTLGKMLYRGVNGL